ncbi:hypothetical protein D0962_37295 [Leptolyngbyaceae cyanobacterium CCMR0082]|uniref:Uncharacterized protein n=2 Tax=Adonisia turfae TaxID=2950184 RepID=A0A6M0SM79_9CYAN|nr:hypothetical protein [Adonisia turfae]NEZ61116.1 hypothetical protein [Adonisia turfae CCMR0081]NEZ68322.1 hypothetical protein [Adonisia turfae CCMR0082]
MLDDQNPLRSQLEDELNSSEWLQKFKAINQLLHTLKADIADISACDLKWDTGSNGLIIHCPSMEIEERLKAQRSKIIAIASYADRITLVQADQEPLILKG